MKLSTLSDHFVACQKDILLVANISSCICIFAMVLSGLLLAVFVIYNVKEGWLIRFWHTDPLATIVKKMSYDWLELHLWWLFQNCCWVMMKGFWKSICICQSYRQEYCGIFDCQWLVIFFYCTCCMLYEGFMFTCIFSYLTTIFVCVTIIEICHFFNNLTIYKILRLYVLHVLSPWCKALLNLSVQSSEVLRVNVVENIKN